MYAYTDYTVQPLSHNHMHTHTHVSKHSPITLAIRQISEIINSVNSQRTKPDNDSNGSHTHTDTLAYVRGW